jgi:hypothetical protein
VCERERERERELGSILNSNRIKKKKEYQVDKELGLGEVKKNTEKILGCIIVCS